MFRKTNLSHRPALIMKAVILCDDFAFTAHAAAALSRVGGQADLNVQWTTTCWPIDALKESALAEKALVEASDAHLILVPEHRVHSLPSWVFDWLSRWALHRTVRDAALGVVNAGNTAQLTEPTFPELSRFVREHSLTFIPAESPQARDPVGVSDPCSHERVVDLPVAQTYLAGLAARNPYRAFGINE